MHAEYSSEPGMVKAWRLETHEKPPSGLVCEVHQTPARDERFLHRGS